MMAKYFTGWESHTLTEDYQTTYDAEFGKHS